MNPFAIRLILLLVACNTSSILLYAGGINETKGARTAALGGASVMFVDQWSVSNNPGAIGLINQFSVAVAYESRYFLPEASLKALAFSAPLGGGSVGIVGHSFGYSSFNENRLGVTYARKLADYISLGVQLNYIQVNIGDVYGQRSAVTGEIGVLVTPNDKIEIGVHLMNPTRYKLADFDDERLPTELEIGASYSFSEKVKMLGQLDKDLELPINARFGFEYEPINDFFLRTGFSTLNKSYAFGIGYKWKGVVLDVSNQWNQQLGFGAAIAIAYTFGNRKQ